MLRSPAMNSSTLKPLVHQIVTTAIIGITQ